MVLFSLWNRLAALGNEMFKLRPAGSELVAFDRINRAGSAVGSIALEAVLEKGLVKIIIRIGNRLRRRL